MKAHKNIIAILLLSLFSCMQLVDLHELSHDFGDSDCKICKLASEGQHDHFVAAALTSVPEEVLIPSHFQKKQYVSPFISSLENSSILNKAPPAIA